MPNSMTPEEWDHIERALDSVLDAEESERPALLESLRLRDESLHKEVLRLLQAHDSAKGPLSTTGAQPAAQFAAPLLADVLTGPRVDTPAPSRIGPWKILSEAGKGGMGTVYLAERDDGAFRMKVGLKVLHAALHLDTRLVRRFGEERQHLARLQHPNIARLLDGGVTDDGRQYYVMEYVDGVPIDQWCQTTNADINTRLALFATVCDAVNHAHTLRILHRDIKPTNVLVTREGTPKLLDFGIAKVLNDSDDDARTTGEHTTRTALTRAGERLLTPEYASPEQILAQPLSPATDVFSLGILLYEMLTGVRPFQQRGRAGFEIERAIVQDEITPPSQVSTGSLQRALRGDIDAILYAALQKDPQQRYTNALEFAADIRRHLAGVPVLAKEPKGARRWLNRRSMATIRRVAAVAAVIIVGAFVFRESLLPRASSMTVAGLSEPVATIDEGAARYYRDGLRSLASGKWGEATQQFRSAMSEDSSFAMAALQAAQAAGRDERYALAESLWTRARELAPAAPNRDRLTILTLAAERYRSPLAEAYTDSLSALFPSDPATLLLTARAAYARGDFLEAAHAAERVLTLDSLSISRQTVPCYACEALERVVVSYEWADSLDAAAQHARRYTALMPNASNAWRSLARVTLEAGNPDTIAFRTALQLDPLSTEYAAEYQATRRIRTGDFHGADAILRARLETAPAGREEVSLWALMTSMRYQKRYAEAASLAERYRVSEASAVTIPVPASALPQAQILFERGDLRAAAALFDSISLRSQPAGAPQSAAPYMWHQTHRADALAAMGDTATVRHIADTLRVLAATVPAGRDRKLWSHVQGLLLAARGEHQEAVRSFTAAMHSSNLGFTRTNLVLARSLIALGRAQEAIAPLEAALRGSLEVNNYYVTHTELHAELSRAWKMLRQPDKARPHDEWLVMAAANRN
jgi:serine/threonine protein kinase